MWSIRVLAGPQAGQIYELKMGKNIFGRTTQCDFQITSLGISKEHCEIIVQKDKVTVVDLKSSNGTFINGVKIQNAPLKIGDKLSLFDVIMDVIPAQEIKPKPSLTPLPPPPPSRRSSENLPPVPRPMPHQMMQQPPPFPMQGGAAMQAYPQAGYPPVFQNGPAPMAGQPYPAMQQGVATSLTGQPAELPKSLSEKVDEFMDKAVMPAVYNLAVLLPFKQVLLGFVILFVFASTILSVIPMTTIMKESNFIEASKRAKSVARALAKSNEQALLSGQLANLTVLEALKEDGIKEALIIQQADGAIVAPSEKAGRESNKPFIIQARKESRAAAARVDGDLIGASHPIGAYDPISGETSIKYHAVVYYDISSLNVSDERVISLFMQSLAISSILGVILYLLFARLIEHPLRQINQQIDTALREKTDRTEVAFDYPELQKVVANVNLLLNRVWNGLSENEAGKPQQNRDVEFTNMTDMLTQPALVIAESGLIVASNYQFEQIVQMSKEQLVQQSYQSIVDPAMVQNIDGLIQRARLQVYEKHQDRIPFSQFECEITLQACLGGAGTPEYYFITLAKTGQE